MLTDEELKLNFGSDFKYYGMDFSEIEEKIKSTGPVQNLPSAKE